MAKKKPKKHDPAELEKLKWETAREQGLEDKLKNGAEMSVREAGKIGGQMVKKLAQAGKRR
ncbi:MAG: small, acid-soluble spore protein, alpha/beta type [Peptococcaceae bacterium]|nr:small, acid-soluble spore protein, alpha/beta type [Peptococcaceae bacterium]